MHDALHAKGDDYCSTVARQMKHRVQGEGQQLASNQVQYSLLYRVPETNGVIEAMRESGATLIAYSPLCQGLLTGAAAPMASDYRVSYHLMRRTLERPLSVLLCTGLLRNAAPSSLLADSKRT